MPFATAASRAYDLIKNGIADEFGNSTGAFDTAFAQSIYGNAPVPSNPPASGNIQGAYVLGEGISKYNGPVAGTAYNPYDPNDVMDSTARHTSSTLVTLLFGESLADTSWRSAMQYIWPAWINDALAKASGFTRVEIPNNSFEAKDVMAVAIAYTAVDHLGPFGTSAIRAMFDDAGQLGRIFSGAHNSQFDVSFLTGTINGTVKDALAEIAVQYAGDLALQGSTDSD